MKSLLRWLLLVPLAAAAQPAKIDFTTSGGQEATCRAYGPVDARKLTRNEDKAAWSICALVATVRETATWARAGNVERDLGNDASLRRIRDRLELVRSRIEGVRRILETVNAPRPLFIVRPGEWVIDWDGDGVVSPFERHLLWVPRRDVAQFQGGGGLSSDASYHTSQFLSPTIKVDQADVHWLLAYLNFGEAALDFVLSYHVELTNGFQVRLLDAARPGKRAHPRLLEGVRQSRLLRAALEKEADDDMEWIPNPRQRDNSFPLVMDPQTFATWGELLGHMDLLFRGRTLLGGTVEQGMVQGVRDLTSGVCQPGQGLNVRDLFLRPLPELWGPRGGLAERCVPPSAAVPSTGLAAMIAASVRRNAGAQGFSGEQMILRHFLWVN